MNEHTTLVGVDGREQEWRWPVPADRIRHFLSWTGDTSDGLPGVRGVGPKKAVQPALDYIIGDQLTYDLSALAIVPQNAMRWWATRDVVETATE